MFRRVVSIMKSKLISACIIGSLIFLLASTPAMAGLGVSGALFMADANPEQSITHEITVDSDPTDLPMNLSVDIIGFGQGLDGANMELLLEDDNSPYSARPFLKATPASFHLEPGASQKVILEGSIPNDVGSGGRYALVGVHSQSMGEGNVGISVGVDVLVILNIAGTDLQKTGEITSLELLKPVTAEHQNVSLIFENTGNYHYKAYAEAVLSNNNGEVIANASTPLSFSSILPTMLREFKIPLSPERKLSPGRYNINASVSLEDGTELATKEIDFKI
jgi:hypothetical protein